MISGCAMIKPLRVRKENKHGPPRANRREVDPIIYPWGSTEKDGDKYGADPNREPEKESERG